MVGTIEQLFLGWHVYTIPRVLLVFTSKRLISLRTSNTGWNDWKWDRGARTLRWGDVESAKLTGLLSRIFKLKLRNGETVSYWRISRADSKKIKLLVDVLRAQGSGQTSETGGMVSLCPSCLSKLVARRYQCPNCRMEFKNEKTLLWRGLLIPGGASFYVGIPSLGVLRFIVESIFLLFAVILILDGILAPHGPVEAGNSLAAAFFLLLVVFLEKGLAIIHCRRRVRDFLPVA